MGKRRNRIVKAMPQVNYEKLLKGNCIGCLTAVYDTQKVGKVYFQLVGHEDYVLWLEILKKGFIALNSNDITALYRVRYNSLSGNKCQALRWTWNILHHIEKLSLGRSIYCFSNYAIKSFIKSFI